MKLEHKIDLYPLLNGEEVLAFSFDDFNTHSATDLIAVQTKELKIYLIDYVKQVLVPHKIKQ